MAGWEDNKVASMCYIPFVGWVFGIVTLASERFRKARDVRFHAFQGLYVFVLFLIISWVFEPIAHGNPVTARINDLLHLVVIGTGVFMLVKTRQGEMIRLPFLGELAEKSVLEQK